MSEKLAPYRVKMSQMQVGQTLLIPWREFGAGKTKHKERSMSDGVRTWYCRATERGILVKRIE